MNKPSMLEPSNGPWVTATHATSIIGWPVTSDEGRLICTIHYKNSSTLEDPDFILKYNKESKANAMLIAAVGTAAQRLKEQGFDPIKAVGLLASLMPVVEQFADAADCIDEEDRLDANAWEHPCAMNVTLGDFKTMYEIFKACKRN